MPLADLLARLEGDARAQVEVILAEAETETRRLTAEAEARRACRREEALGAREAELRVAAEGRLAGARQRARRERLEARERLIERVFAAASALLRSEDVLRRFERDLDQHLEEAFGLLDEGGARIHCPPALVEAVRHRIGKRPGIEVESVPGMAIGLRVESLDGSVEVDNTLDGRLVSMRPELAVELLRRLGPPEGDPPP